jgi:hypothetical protein
MPWKKHREEHLMLEMEWLCDYDLQMEKIIDRRIGKKTRRKTYFEYFLKWKGQPLEDASWVSEGDI